MVPTASSTDVLFHCPSCGTEMCVAAEFVHVTGPCISCGNETSAQHALVHAAQARLMGVGEPPVTAGLEPPGLESELISRGQTPQTQNSGDREILLAQDFENNDSWLLPAVDPAQSPPCVITDESESVAPTLQTAPTFAEGQFTEQWTSTIQPVDEVAEPSWLHPEASPAPELTATSEQDSFAGVSLIDTNFIKNQAGSHLPPPRQQGMSPRRDDADAPFVPNRVIAGSDEGDSTWKEKHRRKSRGHRRKKRVERNVDRLAESKILRAAVPGLTMVGIATIVGFLWWMKENNWGNTRHLRQLETERIAKEEAASMSLGPTSDKPTEPIASDALSVRRSESEDSILDANAMPAIDLDSPLDLSDNLEFAD